MSCLRCSRCGRSWPNRKEFKVCPLCEENTDPIGNRSPDCTVAEAFSERNHANFERMYEKWDAEQPASRLELTAREQLLCEAPPLTGTAAK